MSTGQALYVLGIITGAALASLAWVGVYLWSYPRWHRQGYQDHREEIRGLRNSRELAQAPDPAIRRLITREPPPQHRNRRQPPEPHAGEAAPGNAAGGGSRVTPAPVTRAWTDAASIPPVIWPQPGTKVPMRPQPPPAKQHAPDTGAIRLTDATTGEIRAIGNEIIDRMRRRSAVDRAMIERGEPLA